MTKILITGGSGFIGSYFHEFYAQQPVFLHNLDLVPPQKEYPHSTYFEGDVRVPDDVARALRGCEIIIHLAANHHDFGLSRSAYFDVNERGTQVLCRVAAEMAVNYIVFYSSVAVYGEGYVVTSEECLPAPANDYGASKLAAERVLTTWTTASRRALIIRPAVVFGPRNFANTFNLIRQIDSGKFIFVGKGNNIKSMAYVENLVSATVKLMADQKENLEIFNYTDEPHLTSRQISACIINSLGKKPPLTLPFWLAYLLGLPFDLLIKITGKNLPVSTRRLKKLLTQTFHDAPKIRERQIAQSFTLAEGLEKMVRWYLVWKSNHSN